MVGDIVRKIRFLLFRRATLFGLIILARDKPLPYESDILFILEFHNSPLPLLNLLMGA